MTTALITGAAGFIGSNLTRFCESLGWQVHGLGRTLPAGVKAERFWVRDLLSPNLDELFRQVSPDVVFHCAGNSSVPASMRRPEVDFRDNVGATFAVLDGIRSSGCDSKFILVSSAAVYGNPAIKPTPESSRLQPISPYGYHKLQCETLCGEFSMIYGLRTASIRVFSAYGPLLRRQVVWDLCSKISSGEAYSMQGTGEESRDFIHVEDVCRALCLVSERAPLQAEAYNVAGGRETTISTLVKELTGLFEQKHFRGTFDGVNPKGMPLNWQADILSIGALGFAPSVQLRDGLLDYVTWFRKQNS